MAEAPAAIMRKLIQDPMYSFSGYRDQATNDDVINFHTSDDVAYFIAEPLMGEGGLIVPPGDYFKVAKEVLDAHDVLFIADEVQSGFCRTGRLLSIEHYGVEPDLIAMAKGIANGFPLSAFISSKEIADAFQPGDHLTTFGGNPVSCAASLANIAFMEETNLAEQSAEKGERATRKLRDCGQQGEGNEALHGWRLLPTTGDQRWG